MDLSKSDYMLFLKHPAWLWLKKHQKELLPPVDDNTQALFDSGHSFEEYAEQIFDGNVLKLGFDISIPNDYDNLLSKTEEILKNPPQFLMQARFKVGRLTFICDVIEFIGNNQINLYEIKSSTKVKVEHYYDLAFQVEVLEQLNYKVNQIFVVYVNNRFVRHGQIDANQLVIKSDVTEHVRHLNKVTAHQIKKALKVMDSYERPDLNPIYCRLNSFDEWMKIYQAIEPFDDRSIYNLYLLNAKTLIELEKNDIKTIDQIPDNFNLSEKQFRQINSFKAQKPSYNQLAIKKFLDQLKFPLYFLDYETLASVIPPFDQLRPYQQLPFQYSLHVLDQPDGQLKHFEYLHQTDQNPAQPIAHQLVTDIGQNGSIVVWNMSFESNCNLLLASYNQDLKNKLQQINRRIVDLMIPFSEGWYIDYRFQGSASIKNVFPVIEEKLSYKDLNIAEGGSAQRIWMEVFLNHNPHHLDQDKVIEDLLSYCALDTLAMVKIYQFLRTLIKD